MIVYKKADEWYLGWQRVTKSDATTENERQRVTMNGNEWHQRVVQWVTTRTTKDSNWQRVTLNDNEWPWLTTNDNEWFNKWQRVVQWMKANKSHFRFQNETIMQCKTTIYSAKSFWNYNAKQNIYRSSHQRCSIKKAALNNFEIFTGNHLKAFIKRDSNTSVFLWILQSF